MAKTSSSPVPAVMSSENVVDFDKRTSRRRVIHLPSVSSDCYIALRSIDCGKHDSRITALQKSWNSNAVKAMLLPVAELVVKDAVGQNFVDAVGSKFDAIKFGDVHGIGVQPIIIRAMRAGDVDSVKVLLSVGLNPDQPDRSDLRPSHFCGILARTDLAVLIFPCRPSMSGTCTMKNVAVTPIIAASQRFTYDTDVGFPQRKALRRDVENYIKQKGFETRFPTLPELAVREMWFAVKNLLRRQVVAESEFTEKVEGKTAEQWADFYNAVGVAKEIRYYAKALSDRFQEAAKQMTAMAEKLWDEQNETQKLREQVKQLQQESASKDAKLEELSEAVCIFRSRLEEVGIDCDMNEVATPRDRKRFDAPSHRRHVREIDSGLLS